MRTRTVNISFNKDLLDKIDKAAQDESRSRSELIREAARLYLEKKKKWEDIFRFGDRQSAQYGLELNDIGKEIKKYRSKNKK